MKKKLLSILSIIILLPVIYFSWEPFLISLDMWEPLLESNIFLSKIEGSDGSRLFDFMCKYRNSILKLPKCRQADLYFRLITAWKFDAGPRVGLVYLIEAGCSGEFTKLVQAEVKNCPSKYSKEVIADLNDYVNTLSQSPKLPKGWP